MLAIFNSATHCCWGFYINKLYFISTHPPLEGNYIKSNKRIRICQETWSKLTWFKIISNVIDWKSASIPLWPNAEYAYNWNQSEYKMHKNIKVVMPTILIRSDICLDEVKKNMNISMKGIMENMTCSFLSWH